MILLSLALAVPVALVACGWRPRFSYRRTACRKHFSWLSICDFCLLASIHVRWTP